MSKNAAFMYLGSTPSTSDTNYSITVPFPSADKAMFETSRAIDSVSNANGEVVGRIVGRSISKQNIMWSIMPCDKWWELNRWFDNGHFSFYCHYFNHNMGDWETRLFYIGDIKATPHNVNADTGVPQFYRDASLNIIDCGVI